MPLTAKGEEILAAMKKQYGAEKGEQIFYASKNAGKIKGVDTGAMNKYTLPNKGTGDENKNDLILDADLTDPPERREELLGDIPKEDVEVDKPDDNLPDALVRVIPAPVFNPVPATPLYGGAPLSIPVGDQSLPNMNARNRNFWRR